MSIRLRFKSARANRWWLLLPCLYAGAFSFVPRMSAPITVEPEATPTATPHKSHPKRVSPPKPRDQLTADERQLLGDYNMETKTIDTTEIAGSHSGSGSIKIFMDSHGNLSATGTFECDNSYSYKTDPGKTNPTGSFALSASGNVTGLVKIIPGKQYQLLGKIDWHVTVPDTSSGAAQDSSAGVSNLTFDASGSEKRCFISPPFSVPQLTPNFVAE